MQILLAALSLALVLGCHHSSIPDLPLVEMAPMHVGAPVAVVVSGDGGWRAIDRDIANGLHKRGYGVVGLNSREYFAKRRSPQEAAAAFREIIDHYSRVWGAKTVVAVGYSRGAGVLPFMINRLPMPERSQVSLVALIGLDRTIDFYVTPFDLVRSAPTEVEIPVRPEVERLRAEVLCIYGTGDENNLCRELRNVVQVPERGGHHMNIAYDALARLIWSAAAMPPLPRQLTAYSSAVRIARIPRGIARIH